MVGGWFFSIPDWETTPFTIPIRSNPKVLEDAEKGKYDKYLVAHIRSGFAFVPLASTSIGQLGAAPTVCGSSGSVPSFAASRADAEGIDSAMVQQVVRHCSAF